MSSLPRVTIKHVGSMLYDALLVKRINPPLGRWGLKEKKETIDLSIMYSNEDHCGVCSGYANKIQTENKKKEELSMEDKLLHDEFIWMLGSTHDTIK